MHVLVRDNVPNMIKESNKFCNYASIQNDEMFTLALKQKLIQDVNSFLDSKEAVGINQLIEIKTLVDAFVEVSVGEEKFEKLYQKSKEINGGFEKRYIVFFDDVPQVAEAKEEQEGNVEDSEETEEEQE